MYYSEGCKKAIETQYILAQTTYIDNNKTTKKYNSWEELRNDLNKFLLGLQSEVTLRNEKDSIISADCDKNKLLVGIFNNISSVNDLNQQQVMKVRNDKVTDEQISMIHKGLHHLKKMDSNLYDLFINTINYIFFADSSLAGGGSSSAAIGCIWVNPKSNWTVQDLTELFVHELTHNLLFLDERRYSHYSDYSQLNNPAYFAHSSILKRPRPLDKVVHSFIVASEVLEFRKRNFSKTDITYIHPSTETMLENFSKTYQSLRGLPESLLTERAWEIIEKSYSLHRG